MSIPKLFRRVLVLGATMAVALPALALAAAPTASKTISLAKVGTYSTGVYDKGAAEIPAFDPVTKRIFVVNGAGKTIDVLDASDITKPKFLKALDMTAHGGAANSCSFMNGMLAVAVEAKVKQDQGKIVFFNAEGEKQAEFAAGALPDMLTFSPSGRYVVACNEGEPSSDYTVDPVGSVTIVDLKDGLAKATTTTLDFSGFESKKSELQKAGVRISGLTGTTLAKDLEPEYAAISADSTKAWITLQENNALALVDLEKKTITGIVPLGYKDWSTSGLDAGDKDGKVNIQAWPNVYGAYMPDSIYAYAVGGKTYLVTANEGDTRVRPEDDTSVAGKKEGDIYTDELRVGKATLDATKFPTATDLKKDASLGRLKILKDLGDDDGDKDYDRLIAIGGRSFSIWDADGKLVFDSGNDFESIIARDYAAYFNVSSTNNTLDDRSDDKGPEPEGLALGKIDGHEFAFVGLERQGGVMVYDITDPTKPSFVDYVNPRDFTKDATTAAAGDLAPEGLVFVKADKSPTGKPLLIIGNETSGTTSIIEITSKLPTTMSISGETVAIPTTEPTVANVAGFDNKTVYEPLSSLVNLTTSAVTETGTLTTAAFKAQAKSLQLAKDNPAAFATEVTSTFKLGAPVVNQVLEGFVASTTPGAMIVKSYPVTFSKDLAVTKVALNKLLYAGMKTAGNTDSANNRAIPYTPLTVTSAQTVAALLSGSLADGSFFFADAANANAIASTATLSKGVTYTLWIAVKDGGKYDLDGDATNGKVIDPPVATEAVESGSTTTTSDDDGDSGCVFNPAAGLSLDLLLLGLGGAALGLARRLGRK